MLSKPRTSKMSFGVAVIEHAELRVGGLAVVDVTKAAANAHDRFRQFRLVQPPAGLVHFVDTLVAEVAIAIGPDPVPIVMQTLAHAAAASEPARTKDRN